jgi:hypothetical protein
MAVAALIMRKRDDTLSTGEKWHNFFSSDDMKIKSGN